MAFYDKFPYTNFQELNLDRLIQELIQVKEGLNFVIENASLKYADPIQWNITKQYQANTVVIDPATGTAYISSKPVPANVRIDDTGYWSPIFNYEVMLNGIRENIADAVEETGTTATADRAAGTLVWFGNRLAIVITDISAGQTYSPGYNCRYITVEDYVKEQIISSFTKGYDAIFGNLTASGNADISGSASVGGDLNVTGNLNAGGIELDDVTVANPISAPGITSNGERMEITGDHVYLMNDLTVGALTRDHFEDLVRGTSSISRLVGVAEQGHIGVLGGVRTSDVTHSEAHYPIGVMGLAISDNPDAKESAASAGYFHQIRKNTTSGATLGVEIDVDCELTSQDIHPNSLPNPAENFSCGLKLSSGGGDHTGGNSQPLSTAIDIGLNPGHFRHALVIHNETVDEEAICLPSIGGGIIAWWNDPNNESVDGLRPIARMQAQDTGGYGQILIELYNRGLGRLESFILNRNTLRTPKIKKVTIPNGSFATGDNTIYLNGYLDMDYVCGGVVNMQPNTPTSSFFTVSSWTNTSVTFYNHAEAYNGGFNLLVYEIPA